VGKTTSVVSLGAFLAAAGHRVLLVDMDPQCNATSALGVDKNRLHHSTYDLLIEDASMEDASLEDASLAQAVLELPEFQLALLPASPSLAGAEVELVSLLAREYRLQKALIQAGDTYDYILIDCPPSLSLLTVNALTAARDGVLIPVQCEYLALEGLSQLTHTIQLVQKHLNPELRIRGLIMTMYDGRTNLSRQVVEEVRKHFPGKVFRAIVPRSVRLSEAPSFGQPITAYAPDSPGALAYKVLASELLHGDKKSGDRQAPVKERV
jgi:chromosome partitioning protein